MSAATVRAQMQAFLADPAIPGMQRWYRDQPYFAAGEQWDLAANNGWGAIGWPTITDETESRITLPALTGQKEITYKVAVVLLFQWLKPSTPHAEDAYIGPLDDLIEAVKTRLRSDPKAGTGPGLGGVIFQQSQDDGDLTIARDVPRLAKGGGKVLAWQYISTTVREITTA